jgi:hypothetical protein
VDGRDKTAFTPVFDGLCPAMTNPAGVSLEDRSKKGASNARAF